MASDIQVLATQVFQDFLDIAGTASGLPDNGAAKTAPATLKSFQDEANLPPTSQLDPATRDKVEAILGVATIEAMQAVKRAQLEDFRNGKGSIMGATPEVTAKVQKAQIAKETAKQKADAAVITDEHAVHAAVTDWKAPTTLASAGAGAAIGFVFGGPFGAGIGALIGAAVEHYRPAGLHPVGQLDNKLKLFRAKAPVAPVVKPAGK